MHFFYNVEEAMEIRSVKGDELMVQQNCMASKLDK